MNKLVSEVISKVSELHKQALLEKSKINTILEPLCLELHISTFGDFYVKLDREFFCSFENEDFFDVEDKRVNKIAMLVNDLEFPVLESEVVPVLELLSIKKEHYQEILKYCETPEAREHFENKVDFYDYLYR